MTRKWTTNQALEAYQDWRNNYLTLERFAEHYELTEDEAAKLIETGRTLWDERAERMKNETKDNHC